MDVIWSAKADDTGLVVRLYCIDNKCFLRANKNGRLFADVPAEDTARLTEDCEFQLFRVRRARVGDNSLTRAIVQVKDNKLAFKSAAFGRFLSRGSAFPRFRFPLEVLSDPSQVGAHSCFEQQVRRR